MGIQKLNRYASVFDDYRRQRHLRLPYTLEGIKTPGIPGLVSLVLPVYNGARYLPEALDSILAQTYKDFEVIAVNDGSQDATGEILDAYARKDERIRVVHQSNQGLPRALSNGFRFARGEFWGWTSDDNRLKPDFLAEMVACLRRHPTWDMVYANLDIIDDEGKPLRNSDWYLHYQNPPGSEHIYLPEDPVELNTYPNNYVGAAFLYRDRVGWLLGDYSPLRFGMEDYDYWMQVNSLFHLRHADFSQPLYEYRLHGSSLTARDAELKITQRREKMMVFDTFRRDFYLMPLVWTLELAPSDTSAPEAWRNLPEIIRQSGGILLERGALPVEHLPRLWMPTVFVLGWDGKGTPPQPPANLPSSSIRVLVCLDDTINLPAEVPGGWNLCVALGNPQSLPLLPHERQGWLAAPDAGKLATIVDIFVRSRHLKEIERVIAEPPRPEKRLSVVVCTYRRGALLLDCLQALMHQTLPASEYEIIVVNNDPADEQVNQWVRRFQEEDQTSPRIRLVLCPVPGLSAARNAGIAEATGEVVCFIDDDAIAEPDWLEQIDRAMQEHPEVGVGGGNIILRVPEPRPKALWKGWESLWSQFLIPGSGLRTVQRWWEFPWGANWFARRQALYEMGGFRTRYGRVGRNFTGGEEVVAAALAVKLGYGVGLLPEARVLHCVEDSRFTYEHVWKTQIHGVFSAYLIQRDLYLPYEYNIPYCIRHVIYFFLKTLYSLMPWKWNLSRTVLLFLSMVGFLNLALYQTRWFFSRFRKSFTVQEPGEA